MSPALQTKTDQVPRILLVEDDARDSTLLSEILERAGYECVRAENCAQGRARAEDDEYACALVDLGLPDGSGLSLLGDLSAINPFMVPIVLTGDGSPSSIIETMRAGAFDYLTKPVTMAKLRAAVARAVSHHDAVRDRAELVKLLLEEREQLRSRIDAATADIRQYATQCEINSARFRGLLRLSQLSAKHYPDEAFMRRVLNELGEHIPLICIAVCDITRQRFMATWRAHGAEDDFEFALGAGAPDGNDRLLADANPKALVELWLEEQTGFDVRGKTPKVYSKTFWGRSQSVIGFYLSPEYDEDPADEEFLDMCAHFLAFEWEQNKLLLNIAHHASLGRVAVELARNFVQPLTAIHTALDFISEIVPPTPDFREGMEVISQNIDRLRLQTQELRRLAQLREDSIETVALDEYIEKALEVLSVAIQNRGVRIHRDFQPGCECVLLNGTVLARTFMDLVLLALRNVNVGGRIDLRVQKAGPDHSSVEVRYTTGAPQATPGFTQALPDALQRQPELELVQRTLHSCSGKLSVENSDASECVLRVLLPRNINDTTILRTVPV